ncbi:biotin-dependent carboxyltransferase family protein [Alkalicoccus urumqiensis]|uniref:KipI antagonist n=1 Tax=Alkalicoccus urumqiensis TaxID=1548213 RepID=A0A2P6ML82_ALKUR|nr:biotin-dependent carboxyltransferase family protein [Alkalicoccus urumqiensis]PRO67023.1 KipI antagonist [Alkalicoccus urumqiensis]
MTICIRKAGLLTTIQDTGRPGLQKNGISPGGAMDPLSLQLANITCGNAPEAAGLEITMMGPEIVFEKEHWIVIGGADLSAALDGKNVPRWTACQVRAGQLLTFGAPQEGARAYLAVSGGIQTVPSAGSRATHLHARLGGIEGRELQAGDRIHTGEAGRRLNRRRLHPDMLPELAAAAPFRILPGPEAEEALELLLNQSFTLTNAADRMGFRLEGDKGMLSSGGTMLSRAADHGTIQVPPDGQPIVLMADRQTTGGYPRAGHIVYEDLPRFAQLVPGDQLTFEVLTVEEARELRRKWERRLRCLAGFHA